MMSYEATEARTYLFSEPHRTDDFGSEFHTVFSETHWQAKQCLSDFLVQCLCEKETHRKPQRKLNCKVRDSDFISIIYWFC